MPEQERFVGNQTGGRVTFVLHADDFWRDYHRMVDRGIEFVRPPATAPYGTVAVFKDLYGSPWNRVEPAQRMKDLPRRRPDQPSGWRSDGAKNIAVSHDR